MAHWQWLSPDAVILSFTRQLKFHSFDKQGLYTVEQVGASEKTVDWISIVTLLLMSLGRRWNTFEDTQCKQLLKISGLFVMGILWCYGVAAFSKPNLALFTPFSTYSKKLVARNIAACHSRRFFPFATTTLHVAMLWYGFGTPAVTLRLLSRGLQMYSRSWSTQIFQL